jgi:S-adenosyl methyltransferase
VTPSFLPVQPDPYGIVARLLDAVPSGSYLVLAHTTSDIPNEGVAEAAKRLDDMLEEPYVVRSHAEITRFFDGLELVEPGLVQIDEWHPTGDEPTPEIVPPIYGAVGRKP